MCERQLKHKSWKTPLTPGTDLYCETSEPLSMQEFSVVLLPTAPEYDALKQTLHFEQKHSSLGSGLK